MRGRENGSSVIVSDRNSQASSASTKITVLDSHGETAFLLKQRRSRPLPSLTSPHLLVPGEGQDAAPQVLEAQGINTTKLAYLLGLGNPANG